MRISSFLSGSILATSIAFSAAAQDTKEHLTALVAGYKAHFTCSATFNGGKSSEMIKLHELSEIYGGYTSIMAELPDAIIDKQAHTVGVKYSDVMPPRVSAWREGLGCSQLPIGADKADALYLPRLSKTVIASSANTAAGVNAPWPQGDMLSNSETSAALLDVFEKAFDRKSYGDGNLTSAVLVTSSKHLIGEKYLEGYTPYTSQRTWSVAKSIGASVLGAAVEDGILIVDAPAQIPEWSAPGDPRGKITLANLLHMSSGLYSGKAGNRTDQLYSGGARVTDRSTEHPLDAKPGTRWKYANNDTLLAVRSLRGAMNNDQKYLDYAYTKLLQPLGMHHTNLETDWEGNYILSSQVWTTSRDLARLGILYLNNGVWNGERILPENWRDFVSTPAPTASELPKRGRGWGYGAQFWLVGGVDGLPADSFLAAGNRGQSILIIPSKDIVIIRRGYDGGIRKGFSITQFAADVLIALE